ncbi:MAG: glycosyltransferase [Chitinophagaceae bacterium]|nr:glycosyltransferase [Chitinophagaceae bacterium]
MIYLETIQWIIRLFTYLSFVGVGLFLVIPPVLLFLYLVVGRKKEKENTSSGITDFGIIVTAHEDTRFIDPIVRSLLQQHYSTFHIYVVADQCDPARLPIYPGLPVSILRPEQAINSKVKSIRYAIGQFVRRHQALVIFDVDNLVHPDFLKEVNHLFQQGYKAVQTDFRAKNLNTPFARMDAIGDLYNFFVDREARASIGLSAAIWGSGIAVDLDIYESVTYSDDLGGFDKKLQLHIIQKAGAIGFTTKGFLYDEKISSGVALERQRTRWMSSQFKYFKVALGLLGRSLLRLNLDHFFFALNALRPPLVIQFGLFLLVILLNMVVGQFALAGIAAGVLFLYAVSFYLIVGIRSRWNREIMGTFLLLPAFAARQFAALLKIKQARKSFLKTQQEQVMYIEDVKDPVQRSS